MGLGGKVAAGSRRQAVELTIDVPGMVQIFGDALYQDFGSIVRELVQNGHDAIVSVIASGSTDSEELGDHRIEVQLDSFDMMLVVADDGSGMSRDELAEQLSKFAQSAKRGMRADLANAQASELLQVIGEYGVGFLAAMAVSDSVELITLRKGESKATRWQYEAGDSEAQLSDVDINEFQEALDGYRFSGRSSGTIVSCSLKSDIIDEYEVDEDEIRDSLVRYAALLPIPIYYNDEQISCKYIAWNNPAAASDEDWRDLISEAFREEPLAIVTLYSPPEELDITGVLWVPANSTYFETGIDVYVKRMFVTTDRSVVVPNWSRFLRGMVNSNKVRRIVSGNSIKDDAAARAMKAFIRARIIDAFSSWRRLNTAEYSRIINPHDEVIKSLAADDDEFRECVWDKLRFQARGRKVTLPEYQRAVRRKAGAVSDRDVIYFNDSPKRVFQANLISDATGIPILDLTQTRDIRLVKRLSEIKEWEMLSEQDLAARHFLATTREGNWDQLVSACAQVNIYAEVREYEPDYLPAVFLAGDLENQEAQRSQLLRGLKEFGEERFAKDLEAIFARARAANAGSSFYLNARNPLVQSLAAAPYDIQIQIGLALYNISFMSVIPDLHSDELREIFRSITAVLSRMIRNAQQVGIEGTPLTIAEGYPGLTEAQEADHAQGVVRLFVMMPYDQKYDRLESALRKIYESDPYYFKVDLARDRHHDALLTGNLRQHIEKADAFIAELTEPNLNVLLEVGGVLYGMRDEPLIILRENRSGLPDLPVDIRDLLSVKYRSVDDDETFENNLRSSLERDGRPVHDTFIQLIRKRQKKALTSTTLMNSSVRVTKEQMRRILGKYETIEQFLEVTPEEISRNSGMKENLIAILRAELEDLGHS